MKKLLTTSLCAALLAAPALAQSFKTPEAPGTTTWPWYNEVVPGQWTMNYDGAMAAAQADGRDVVLYFGGVLWCPDCTTLDANVLHKPLWKAATADAYLVALDFVPRNGIITNATLTSPVFGRVQAFLHDDEYWAFAGISEGDANARMRYNYELQNEYQVSHVLQIDRGANQAAIQTRYGVPPAWLTLWYPTIVYLKGNAGSAPAYAGSFFWHRDNGINNANPAQYAFADPIAVEMLGGFLGRPCFAFDTPGNAIVENLVVGIQSNIRIPFINTLGGAPGVKITSGSLPAGLKIEVEGNHVVISGLLKKAESSVITLQLFNDFQSGANSHTFNSQVLQATLAVQHFTAVNPTLPGVYTGWLADPDGGFDTVAGQVTATVAASGKVSVKLDAENQTFTLRSRVWDKMEGGVFTLSAPIRKNNAAYRLVLRIDGTALSGEWVSPFKAAPYAISGARNIWNRANNPAAEFEGYYTLILPPNPANVAHAAAGSLGYVPAGCGFLAFTIAPAGTVRYSGRLADGTRLSGSSALVEDPSLGWLVPVYKSLYSRTGAFGVLLPVQTGATPSANTVSLARGGWLNNGRQNLKFADAFWMRQIEAPAVGGWYDKRQNLADYYGAVAGFTVPNPGVAWVFLGGSHALDATLLPDRLAIVPSGTRGGVKLGANGAKATLNANRSTGLATGKFNIVYNFTNSVTGKASVKTISNPWRGILTPCAASVRAGAGYYLLPDPALESPFNTLKKSFPVIIEK